MGSAASKPSSAGAEHVYPLHAMDSMKMYRDPLAWIMHFNDVLDATKLKEALETLLRTGDWKKLSGRLRYTSNKTLQYHVPTELPVGYPLVAFSHNTENMDMPIKEHPVASKMPNPDHAPSIQRIHPDLRDFAVSKDFPIHFDNFVEQESPQIMLHITSFSDATIVTLAWYHTLTDALGMKALMHAWSLVLAGRLSEVPALSGATEDILQEVVMKSTGDHEEELAIESKRYRFGILGFMLQQPFPKESPEWRMICLPEKDVQRMCHQAELEVADHISTASPESKITENDVFVSWMSRIIANAQTKARPVTIITMQNSRFRLRRLVGTGVYVQNMTLVVYSFLSSTEVTSSVGEIAVQYRQQCLEQTTEGQSLSFLRGWLRDIKSGKKPGILFGPPDATVVYCNNLSPMKQMETADFSPAVVRKGDNSSLRKNPLGTMTSHFHQRLIRTPGLNNLIYIFGKDHGNKLMLMANLTPSVWKAVEKDLSIDSDAAP